MTDDKKTYSVSLYGNAPSKMGTFRIRAYTGVADVQVFEYHGRVAKVCLLNQDGENKVTMYPGTCAVVVEEEEA